MTVPVLTPPTLPLPGPAAGPPPRLRVARVLLLVEMVLALVSTLESAVVAVVGLGTPTAPLLTGGVAVVLALVTRRAGRPGRPFPRRLVLVTQGVLLAAAGVDLVVALAEQAAPLLVPTLTRAVLPAAVVVLVRRR